MQPGDFAFVAKRDPIRKVEQVQIDPPTGFFRRLWWEWFGKKYALREVLELLWPEYDAVLITCPSCHIPSATTREHKIISLDPLTIETPITCPYCKTVTFKVEEGQLVTA